MKDAPSPKTIWADSVPPERTPAHIYLHARNAWSSPASDIPLPKCVRWLPSELADSFPHPAVASPVRAAGFAVFGFADPPWAENREQGVKSVRMVPLSQEGEQERGWASFMAGSFAGSVLCAKDEVGDPSSVVFAISPVMALAAMWVVPAISAKEPGLYCTFPEGYGNEVEFASIDASVFADRTDRSAKLLRSVAVSCPGAEVFYPGGEALTWDSESADAISELERYLASSR